MLGDNRSAPAHDSCAMPCYARMKHPDFDHSTLIKEEVHNTILTGLYSCGQMGVAIFPLSVDNCVTVNQKASNILVLNVSGEVQRRSSQESILLNNKNVSP